MVAVIWYLIGEHLSVRTGAALVARCVVLIGTLTNASAAIEIFNPCD
jgi:hypothetical protein